ncbi:MAG: hypothetical protein JRH11_08820 [Deltaproteobacteria bacterium]|nr:hypothetical protein [Deltaproteobacteria bacterium]
MSLFGFSVRWAPVAPVALVALVASTGCSQQQSAALLFGPGAESCGTCHEQEYRAWSTSPHATSGTSPVFEALLVEVEDAWGAGARDACVDCHQPSHAGLAGEMGIGCVSCHAATGNTGERDGRLRVDWGLPLIGPTGQGSNGAHEIRTTGFLTSASLCGTCHEVTGPGLLDEPTLTEHRATDFAEAGISCATCHMPEGEHRFVGLDPPWGAGEEARQRAAIDARALFQNAVSLEVARLGDDAVITLTNVGAGHSVPTGAAFLRDVWVDVSFTDREGEGSAERLMSFGAEMTLNGASVGLITEADTVVSHSLAAGEARQAQMRIPTGATSVTATLRLRAVRWQTLDALGLSSRRSEVPTIDVETVVMEL